MTSTMAPIDTEPTRMSTRLVEKRRELACQESSDKPVLEKRSEDEKTNGEFSQANANSGIVIKITNIDNEDYTTILKEEMRKKLVTMMMHSRWTKTMLRPSKKMKKVKVMRRRKRKRRRRNHSI